MGDDPKPALMQRARKDIANKEVRPDVYVTVWKNVSPAANFRSDKPPNVGGFSKYDPPPKADIAAIAASNKVEEKKEDDAALIQ